jgi:hypothetical protein
MICLCILQQLMSRATIDMVHTVAVEVSTHYVTLLRS